MAMPSSLSRYFLPLLRESMCTFYVRNIKQTSLPAACFLKTTYRLVYQVELVYTGLIEKYILKCISCTFNF